MMNRSRKRERCDNKEEILEFKYDLFKNPYVTPLLYIAVTGDCPDGSAGIRHGEFMQIKTNETIRIVTKKYHRLPQGIIFDLTNLRYEWGDWMASVFFPFPILQAVVAVGNTKEALSTLMPHMLCSIPMFETVEDAINHIETGMRRTFIIKCPACTGRFRGKSLTPYICPKCGYKLIIDFDGKVFIRTKPIEESTLDFIDRISSDHKT